METDVSYWFVCGADMDPTKVRETYPGARFVARARLAELVDGIDGPAELWGILIAAPGSSIQGAGNHAVITDDGRSFHAHVGGHGRPSGEPTAVVAAARYWELPPAYVHRLAGAITEHEA
jgi:hypothetical protein